VYRLTFADGSTAIRYVWDAAENYWPPSPSDGVFADASGLDLFLASHALLGSLGVRVPRVYEVDGNAALVEDVPGGTLEALLQRDPAAGRECVDRLAAALRVLHGTSAAGLGRPGSGSPDLRAPDVVLDRALRHLDEAAVRVDRIDAVRDRLSSRLPHIHAAVAPRTGYALIHELGPDHVLVDGAGRPVLIDIEGIMYFDVEWEHAFLELRFGALYARLGTSDLDAHRLRLYRLATYLSLVAGPLRLLDGDFPDREPMLRIVEYNVERTLRFLDADGDGR
jgi:hypothetical protein